MAETEVEASFNKVRLQINSNIVQVKRPATLLLAIDQTLASSTPISPNAYLLALLSTLNQLDPGQGQDQRDLLEATLYLLALLAPHLDKTTLNSKHHLLATISPLFGTFSAHAPAIKSIITISQFFLSALNSTQLEKDIAARSVFASILTLTNDPRPKVRRKAQEAIAALLSSPPPPAISHPYANETAGWILVKLEEAVKGAKRRGKKEEPKVVETTKQGKGKDKTVVPVALGEDVQGSDESRAIALLVFIKNLGSAWSDESNPTLLPILISVLTLSSPHLTLTALTLLSHLFSSAREADSISANSVKETLLALIDAKPKAGEGEASEKLSAGWVEGVGEGMVAFARTSPGGALEQTTTLFPSVLALLPTATTSSYRLAIETALELMIRHCIPDSEILAALTLDRAVILANSKSKTPTAATGEGVALIILIDLVEKSLTSSRYAGFSLPHVLALSKALFSRLRLRPSTSSLSAPRPSPAAATLLGKTLVLAGKMREDDRFEWKREAETVLDSAVKVCGPAWVLSTLPLGLEEGANPTRARAWLLPLLKPSITNTQLGHFKSYFVPLSAEMFTKAEKARANDKGMEGKVWETLVGQIWGLLPGYCEFPTDLVEAFDTDFVSLLATVLYSQPNLRPTIFKALSVILSSATSLASSTSPPELLKIQFGLNPQQGQLAVTHLRTLAPAILGAAFNVYEKLARGDGAYVLACIGEWFALLEPAELNSRYEVIEGALVEALKEAAIKALTARSTRGHGPPQDKDETIPRTHALLDILVALVPYASGDVEKRLCALAMSKEVLGSKDPAVQKKGYRIVSRLAEEKDAGVFKGRVGEVLESLVEAGDEVAQGAKRDRTMLLSTLVPLLPSDALHHIPSLIPEAVLGTKESNERTREAAYDLIVGMGRKMGAGGVIHRNKVKGMEDGMAEEAEATLNEFITMVSAGLAGASPHMISATITSLSRLIFEFHPSLPQNTLSELLTTIIIFLSSANREIVRSAIGYVKVTLVSLPSTLLQPQLPTLIPALINWSHEHSNHFKVKIRGILERLVRKFGYKVIEREVPEDDRKLISNIRKKQMRSKKKKEGKAEEDGEANMDEDEPAPKPQTATRSAYDQVLYGSDSEGSAGSDSEGEGAPATTGGAKNRKAAVRKAKHAEAKAAKGGDAYLHEDEDEVLDLLDDRMMSRISATRPTASSSTRPSLSSHFPVDEASGRLRISAPSETTAGADANNSDDDDMGSYMEAIRGEDGHTRDAKGKTKFNKKRGRGGDEEEVTEGIKELDVGGGGERRKKKKKEAPEKIGKEFKAKNAGGDVQRNGMNPYAYVPLSSVAGKGKNKKGGGGIDITGHKKGRKERN